MPTFVRRAFVLGFLTLASTVAAMPARAQGSLVVYCGVNEEWCRGRVDRFRARDRHQGFDDAQEFRRDLRAAQGRGGKPAGRYLVGRHRRPAHAGRGGGPHHRVQVAEAWRPAGLGRAAMGAVEGPHCRRLFGRARLRLQHRTHQEERRSPSRNAGPICSTRSSRTRCRWPTRIHPAPPTRCSRRSCS